MSKPAVINPYAKKKSAAAPLFTTIAAPPVAAAANDGAPTNATSNSKFEVVTQKPLQVKPPPPPVDPSSTFSQAFGDHDADAHFGAEERSQQQKFDDALITIDSKTDDTIPEISARDNQVHLAHHVLHVSTRQRGNPILNHVRNVPFQESKMVPDYIFSPTRCALFLSIRYHNLHQQYIHKRIAELGQDFGLRILLCYVDIDDNANVILYLNDLCVQNNFTLILAWSEEEAARYLETFKAFDGKDASLIQKRELNNYPDQIAHVLGSVRSVNKTDASQLLSQFGTWKNLVGASVEELSVCPGVGVKKVRRLYEAFHRPFAKEGVKKRKEKMSDKSVGDESDKGRNQESAANQENEVVDTSTDQPANESNADKT
ncbi:hypothetical protein ACHAXN_001568 [Cyclotella atomus]|jgi:DNA excision repair protein ERCC-1